LRGLSQFLTPNTVTCPQTIENTQDVRLNMREGGFCVILIATACNSLILKRRDVGVVDRARLESEAGERH
jgi:hypothetical protein